MDFRFLILDFRLKDMGGRARYLNLKSKIKNQKFLPLLLLLLLLPACAAGYEMRGRVIEGSISTIVVVNKNDPRLGEQAFGLGGAAIDATLDPQRLNRQHLPRGVSQLNGEFAIPVSAAGAGFLEYDVEVLAQLPGHAPAIGSFRLPGGSKRVLVILAPGAGEAKSRQDRMLEQTLEMGEPYMKE